MVFKVKSDMRFVKPLFKKFKDFGKAWRFGGYAIQV